MKIKTRPEDFKVVEVLKEKPSREKRGRYRYYRLFKKGMETPEAIRRVASLSGLRPGDVLYAGLKDKNARTVQFVAVRAPLKLKKIRSDRLKLEFSGWLDRPPREVIEGNRFEITVRGVEDFPRERIEILKKAGLPNYYGEQRFTPVRGGRFFVLELLKGPEEAVKYLFTPAGWENSLSRRAKKLFIEGDFHGAAALFKGWRRKVAEYLAKGGSWEGALSLIPRDELEFQANVFQAYLFNRLLSELVRERSSAFLKFRYKLGYLYYPVERVEFPEELPVFTPSESLYDTLLLELGAGRGELSSLSHLFHPFKRRTFVRPGSFRAERLRQGYLFEFFLPSGSYATNLLRFLLSAV